MKLLPTKARATDALAREVGMELLKQQKAELRSLQEELSKLTLFKDNAIKGLCALLVAAWRGESGGSRQTVHFDDPVWGHTYVEPELTKLFFHPLVQRLNHIKQLSFAYLTFPNATHSRLAHSLGTCRNLDVALTTMFRNNLLYRAGGSENIPLDGVARRKLIIKARAAALLHDIGHAPFGHALDKLIGYFDANRPLFHPDKHYSHRYLKEYLEGSLPDFVDRDNLAAILRPDTELSGWDTLVTDLLDSPLDADRMDFLARDAHMTGLSTGVTSVEAIIEAM